MLIFGRSPAVWLAAIQSVLAILVTLPALGFGEDLAAAVMVVVSALVAVAEAIMARPFVVSALTGAVRTLLVGLVAFGLPLSEATTGALVAALAMVLALVMQPNTTPTGDPAPGFLNPTRYKSVS